MTLASVPFMASPASNEQPFDNKEWTVTTTITLPLKGEKRDGRCDSGSSSSSPCTLVARFPQRSRLAIDSIERFECVRCSPSHKKAFAGFIPGLFNFGAGCWPQARSKAGESDGGGLCGCKGWRPNRACCNVQYCMQVCKIPTAV